MPVRLRPLLALLLCLLVQACARPEAPTINLYRAIHAGDLDQIKRHIHQGTDLNQTDPDGRMPLHVAAEQGNQVICELLIDHGARLDSRDRDGRTPLDVAVLAGKVSLARLLLRRGAALDPNRLLREAIRAGTDFREVYEFLVHQGADLNAPDAAGGTPLLAAVGTGNRVTVRRLIDQGADVNRAGADGLTPLRLALQIDNQDIVRLLRQYGASAAP